MTYLYISLSLLFVGILVIIALLSANYFFNDLKNVSEIPTVTDEEIMQELQSVAPEKVIYVEGKPVQFKE
jgi:hypothetical protein